MKTNSISENCASFIYTGLRISYTRTIPASQLWLGHGLTPLPSHTLQVSFGWALGSINLWIVLVPLPPQNRQVITLFPPQLPQVQWPNLNNDILYLSYFLEFSSCMNQKIEVIYYNAACLSRGNGGGEIFWCFYAVWRKICLRGIAAIKWRPWRDSNSRPTA